MTSLYPHNPDAVHSRLPVMFDKLDDMKENERHITMTMLYNISQKHPEVMVLVSITSTLLYSKARISQHPLCTF